MFGELNGIYDEFTAIQRSSCSLHGSWLSFDPSFISLELSDCLLKSGGDFKKSAEIPEISQKNVQSPGDFEVWNSLRKHSITPWIYGKNQSLDTSGFSTEIWNLICALHHIFEWLCTIDWSNNCKLCRLVMWSSAGVSRFWTNLSGRFRCQSQLSCVFYYLE